MQQLPTLWTRFGLLTTGEPDAYIDSVVAITKNHLWASLLLSYDMQLFGAEFSHASQLYLVVLDPKDGSIIRSWPVPSSSESGISLSPEGDVYISLLAAQSSIAHNAGYQWMLPADVRMPAPVGGIIGFRAE